MKRCKKCGLPKSYPGVQFNKDNICNYCVYFEFYKKREEEIKRQLKKEFIKVIEEVRRKTHKSIYDCIVAYSGGKDSTFLLYFLKKKFNLKILAHTLDNGFVSPQALRNIKKVINILDIDHKITRPRFEIMKKVFTYALTERIPYPKEVIAMMSQVCAVCLGMVLGTTLKLAIRLKVPLIFVGFTPGQYPAISLENFLKVKSCFFLSYKVYRDDPLDIIKIISDPVREKFGREINRYYFKSQYVSKRLFIPKTLLPFHALLDYDEGKILKEIAKLGWKRPQDTDTCSTNCLINTVGNYAHIRQWKFHPYVGELSYLVREGKIRREDVISSEKIDENAYALRHTLDKLGLKIEQILDNDK